MREAGHAEFKKNEHELVDANDELERAEVVVKKEMGSAFLQGKTRQKVKLSPTSMKAVVDALSKVVDASWIGNAQAKTLKGFLQQQQGSQEDAEDKDLTMEPAKEGDAEGGGVL